MIVGVLTIDIIIPASASLKDKRMVLNHIRDRVHSKFNVSVAEVDFMDKWQRSIIAVAIVTAQRAFAEDVLTKIFQLLDVDLNFEISKYTIEYR
jgi:uncharacterized protein